MAPQSEDRKPKTWLIVGASRGIGREFVNQLLDRGDRVFATVRGDTKSQGVPNAVSLKCDITDEGSIEVETADHSDIPPLTQDARTSS